MYTKKYKLNYTKMYIDDSIRVYVGGLIPIFSWLSSNIISL
jgi:hypothetical protein